MISLLFSFRPSTAGSSRPVSGNRARITSKSSSRPTTAHPGSRPVSGHLGSPPDGRTLQPDTLSTRPVSAHHTGSRTGSSLSTPQQLRQRPHTAGYNRSDSKSSDESDFVGGNRMEALLQALHHEREAGGFFNKFINRSANKVSYDIFFAVK